MTGADGGIALVTGASRGLGLECVRQLLGHGLVVLAGVRDVASGRRALDALGGRDRLRVVPLDVSSPDDVAGCGNVIRRDFGGRLDVLVNNAAVHYDSGQTALTADWRVVAEAIDTNVLGAWRVARMVAPFMQARRRGRIVNVSSAAGAWASLGARTPAYSLSKLALNGLTRMLASELHGSGILVNAVCPGWVATDMGGPGGRPVEDGAGGIVWAALLPEDGPTGGFFRDGRAIPW
jgi:NAD(P)-dependent dehydrogenase (short-subunit alcohol dehydrogenase family)